MSGATSAAAATQAEGGAQGRKDVLKNIQNLQVMQDLQDMQNMQDMQNVKVELEERRDVLPVVFPTMQQLAPLEMFHSPELPSAGQQGEASLLVPWPVSFLCLFCTIWKT